MAGAHSLPATFPRHYRLHNKSEFDAVYRQGRRQADAYFSLTACDNRVAHPRLGLSIGAKAVGNAVRRNKIKRILRESFRRNAYRLPPLDIVINARPPCRSATANQLTRSLARLWDKLAGHA